MGLNLMADKVDPRTWRPEYEIGHEMIDNDHRKLLELANRVGEAINARDAKRAVALMQHFVEVARTHFTREEALMRDIKFERFDAHVRYHQVLLSSASNVMTQCASGTDLELVRESFEMLANCLLDDVISGDKELRPHLRA